MAQIKLISECFVKPKYEVEAAKQPYHLSPLEIGMLSMHPIQKGLLFSLSNPPSTNDRTKLVTHLLEKLKHSLSITLVHFFPLAGRFVTTKYPNEHSCSISIDCVKGPGVRLIHAAASLDVTISSIVSSNDVPTIVRSMFELGEKSVNYDGHTRALLSVQVTELQDGVFIGFTMNHSVVDGTSFIHFVSMLSEIFRSKDDIRETHATKISSVPIYNYKPWVDNKDQTILKLPYLEPEEFIELRDEPTPLRERIFHFSPAKIAALKSKANQDCGTLNVISSFQALSALVWRSITQARNLSPDQVTTCSLLVNARNRFDPPFSNNYFGNYIFRANGDCNVDELLSHDLGWSAMKLCKAIKAQDGKIILDFYKSFVESPKVFRPSEMEDYHGSNTVVIGGSTRVDMYEPEFGLSRALAIYMGYGNKEDGKVTAKPGYEEGSVDLEICLKPHFMAALETNQEFMNFVSLI